MIAPALALLLQAPISFAPPSDDLRAAQARFESVRRASLPIERGTTGYRCDVRIGRFCHWSDSAAPAPERPESPRTLAARDRWLEQLDAAEGRWPGDPWIAGQRVRYLIDAGRADSAANLRCGAPSWWCDALRGLALHVAARNVEADIAFTAALRDMPPEARCDWVNLALIMEDRNAREFRNAGCEARERLATIAWRLMQPLWLDPGNDARSEHLARMTMAVILERTATPHGTQWSPDMRELLLRYGWAERHTRATPSGLDPSWTVIGHDREPDWSLMPRVASLAQPWVDANAWTLRAPKARSLYAPRHVSALLPHPHQLVRIPRGDSMQLSVAFLLPAAVRAAPIREALGVLQGDSLRVVEAPSHAATVTVPGDTLVVSVEALGKERRAWRSRYSVAPLGCARAALCLSDLLLFDGGDSVSLGDALRRAIGESLPAATTLGVWWHLRGSAGTVRLTAAIEPELSVARRMAQAARLAPRSASTRISWRMRMPHDTASAHVTLRFPEGARGRYRVSLTAEAPGAPAATSTRSVIVR